MVDLLSRPRALRCLLGLAKKQPSTMRHFLNVSGYTWESGDMLLHDFVNAGLVTVGESRHGIVRSRVITLTPIAHEIIKHATVIDELLQQATAKKPDETPQEETTDAD